MNVFQEWLEVRGNTAKLAEALDITHSAVRQWEGKCPDRWVIQVEAATGIPREALCPHLYRRPPALTTDQPAAA